MSAIKTNVVISQFHSCFKRLFCVWFDTEICCLTVKRNFKVCNLQVMNKIYLEKRSEKNRTVKEKSTLLLYWPSSTVCSDCSNFKVYVQKKIIYPTYQTLYLSYRRQTSLKYLAQIFVLHFQLALWSWKWSLEHLINQKKFEKV